MIGVGRIFADYLSGKRIEDGDVAVPTSDEGSALGPSVCDLEQLSTAMATDIDIPAPRGMIEALVSTYYLDRTDNLVYSRMLDFGVGADAAYALVYGVLRDTWAVKMHDALQAVDLVINSTPESDAIRYSGLGAPKNVAASPSDLRMFVGGQGGGR